MFHDIQRLLIYAAILSIATSLSMVIMAFAAPTVPIWPIIIINWGLFMTVSLLTHHQFRRFGKLERTSRTNHNIWRVVILSFSGCGFIAIANGATVV